MALKATTTTTTTTSTTATDYGAKEREREYTALHSCAEAGRGVNEPVILELTSYT